MNEQPIQDDYKKAMNHLAGVIDSVCKIHEVKTGFILLMFEQNTDSGRMNYISNSNREDCIKALKEFTQNMETR